MLSRIRRPIINFIRKCQYSTSIFNTETIKLHDMEEQVIIGGKDKFPLLSDGFKNIKNIGIIGWGSQAPAQACNLVETLSGTDIKVNVGLREDSESFAKAEKYGFSRSRGNLGEMYQVASESDMVLYLVSDYAQTQTYSELFKHLKPNTTLGLSHGFLLGYFENNNIEFPDDINVVMVAPKGMGPSVREKYINGSGINSSFAVQQDVNGLATDHAISWAVALGSPYIFNTTMRQEYISDLFGERGILLGAIYGMSEALYRYFLGNTTQSYKERESYRSTAYNITGTISKEISNKGLNGLYKNLGINSRPLFNKVFYNSYPAVRELLEEIYDEVYSGNEIRSVVLAGERLQKTPMTKIDTTSVWKIEKELREQIYDLDYVEVIPAAIYTATMLAQVDILMERGHNYSEIANESIIEALDSLNPYLHEKGISHMVDNCSTTARLGARKWGPRFDYILSQTTLNRIYKTTDPYDANAYVDNKLINHPIHDILKTCNQYRNNVEPLGKRDTRGFFTYGGSDTEHQPCETKDEKSYNYQGLACVGERSP